MAENTSTADNADIDPDGDDDPSERRSPALIATAIDAYDAEESLERAAFLASARGGRPRANHAIGRTVELNYQGQ